jgi:hypothetical protein
MMSGEPGTKKNLQSRTCRANKVARTSFAAQHERRDYKGTVPHPSNVHVPQRAWFNESIQLKARTEVICKEKTMQRRSSSTL